ncbi:hypothetical protein [Actinomarinicola tropica]|uniref:hypothetical protein n=1 Tax=Actinomarinicola tropica TaxID=2789776 RepID=UPI001E40F8DF|nr:hypothetical protein [Actinomarinicola tropica]
MVALVSVVTSPLTAIWFLLLGPLALVVGAAVAAATPARAGDVLGRSAAVAMGLLAGPLLYLGLAVTQ